MDVKKFMLDHTNIIELMVAISQSDTFSLDTWHQGCIGALNDAGTIWAGQSSSFSLMPSTLMYAFIGRFVLLDGQSSPDYTCAWMGRYIEDELSYTIVQNKSIKSCVLWRLNEMCKVPYIELYRTSFYTIAKYQGTTTLSTTFNELIE